MARPNSQSGFTLPPDLEKEIRHRLSRLQGHLNSLQEMIRRRRSCEDLIQQAHAIRSAMSGLLGRLVEGHLRRCVGPSVRSGPGGRAFRRLTRILSTALRRTG